VARLLGNPGQQQPAQVAAPEHAPAAFATPLAASARPATFMSPPTHGLTFSIYLQCRKDICLHAGASRPIVPEPAVQAVSVRPLRHTHA
jgi:hypothetical protein